MHSFRDYIKQDILVNKTEYNKCKNKITKVNMANYIICIHNKD